MASLGSALPCGVHVVGAVHEGPPGQVTVVDAEGRAMTPPRRGWDHFA